MSLEQESAIRRRILREFNKTRQDFDTLREYNDYLEEVEDIIYNLVYQIDVEATNQKISEYKQNNKTQIALNKVKMVSKSMTDKPSEQKDEKKTKINNVENLNENEKYQPRQSTMKLQPSITGVHSKIEWDSLTEEEQAKITEKRKIAGGYDINDTTKRAFQEAFSSIFPTKLE
eukprot:gene4304-7660_t